MSHAAVEPHSVLPAWRRLPIGAEVAPDGGIHFRVWAPKRRRIDVLWWNGRPDETRRLTVPLEAEENGYFSTLVGDAAAGAHYQFRLDGGESYADPASRFQPTGPHGPSQVIDPLAFRWSDGSWRGVSIERQVIYELHIGTFTKDGTWRAATAELPELASLGVTVVEVMPVAEFAGRFGWGYDGVDLFAPTHLYGKPDDFRRFVDEAHRVGVAVILDVVYNHLGPDGNFLHQFSDHYFGSGQSTEWGDAPNFDGEHAGPVREFVTANVRHWIEEYHLDGLRLDATQSMFDRSTPHIVAEVGAAVRAAARGRSTLVVAENEPQHARQVRGVEHGGYALDALWNDDFHHSAIVALTGRDEGYYSDYRGTAQELLSAVKYGFLYQGQWNRWQHQRRGEPALDLEPFRFVHFIENHDQVANSASGARLHDLTSPGRWRAMTALLLLAPQTPMLFQGQEFAASSPFVFFADHHDDLASLVAAGRREFLAQFASLATPEVQASLPAPHDVATFERCKLDLSERERNQHAYDLHRDLLRLRREDPCFASQRHGAADGAVLSTDAFVLRFFATDGMDRLVVVNLGRTLHLDPAPEPLLAPPLRCRWRIAWSSDDPRYGGHGTPELDAPEVDRRIATGNLRRERPPENWRVPGEATVVLVPQRR